MTFNHLKMIPKRKIITFVPIANTYFHWWVWGFGKGFLVGLPETHPTSALRTFIVVTKCHCTLHFRLVLRVHSYMLAKSCLTY